MSKLSVRLLAGVLACVCVAGAAQTKRKVLDKETFMDMESVSSPAISPDGKQIVFTRTWVDKAKDQYRSNLWIVDADGGRVRELTHGNWRDSAPVWSPEGRRIAFISDRDGTTQLHVMWADTREVAQLTHVERAPAGLSWSPDGKQLAFTMFMPDNDPILAVKLPERPRGAEWAKPAVIVNRLTWARDGQGPLPMGYGQAFVVDATLGGTPRQVTSGKYTHNDPEWAAEGRTLYLSAIRKPEAEYLRNDSEIYAVDLQTLEVKALTERKGPDGGARVSPSGQWIAYTGYDDKSYTSHLLSLYLMDRGGGGKRVWADKLLSSPQNVSWASDNSGVYFTVEEKGSTHV
ncbi:MAG TPA: DPP IV N-terminal domain-containing protein, partial [Blastocatellia bacterium]|nr:DPP IV N-terminal domain-containing protein [Blastocatellia bacterium]